MAEHIEREAVIQKIQDEINSCPFYGHQFDLEDVKELIKNFPAADVTPVVKSEWEILTDDYGNEYMRCKRCGGEFYDGDNDTVDTKHNFCPNCGADMRKG